MMAQFIDAFKITMGNEGGYANNPDDSGGETYAGIAHNYWPSWQGWPIVHAVIAQKPANLNKALTANSGLQTQVQAFYKANFWDTLGLDSLNSQQTANMLFDTGVNMGTGIAARFLQQAVNNITPAALVVDGVVGPRTLAAANSANTQLLYNQVIGLRRNRYMAIIAANPSQAQFERSWLSRLTPYNPSMS